MTAINPALANRRPSLASAAGLGLLLLATLGAATPGRASLPRPGQQTETVGYGTAPEAPAAPARGQRVPKPDLSAMEEAAQQKVRLAQATLEQALDSGSLAPAELADGFGFLGQLYHAYKLLDAAELCYAEARALVPGDFRWAYLVGLVRFAKGDLERSAEDFAAALALDPGNLPTLLRLGNAMIELNEAGRAAAHFESALESDPNLAAALYGLGKAAALAGDDARAAELFERVLALQPEASIVHYPLGQAYRRLGNREAALEQLKQRGQDEVAFDDPLGRQVSRLALGTTLEVLLDMAGDTDGFSERDFLGFTLSQFGDTDGVVEQLEDWLARRAAAAEPTDALRRGRVHYVVGGLQVQRQQDEAAISHFRRALELAPELEDARIKLGNAIARAGDFEAALVEYETVLATSPEGAEARLKRAAALMELERWEEAREELDRLVGTEPGRIEVRARHAAVLERLGDFEAALAEYRATLGLDVSPSERLRLLTKVAELETSRGRVEEAIAAFREALDIDEAYAPAVAGQARLLAALNRFPEALPMFTRWAALEPRNPRPRLSQVTALIFSGDFAAATERLEAAIAEFPSVLDFKDVLARHLAACPEDSERDGERALELALEVFEQVPTPQSVETLAMAYAEAGRFAEAVDWQEQLLQQVRDEEPAEVVGRLEANLERYRQGLSCCGAPQN